jgi:tetratricopeptide (TPR) repeat protein
MPDGHLAACLLFLSCLMIALLALLLMAPGSTRADADALFQAGNYQEAGEIYLSLLRASPRDPVLLDSMGQTLLRMHQYRTAIAFFQQEIKLDPANYAAGRSLALTLQEGGDPEEARRLLTKLTTADPSDPENWFLLGTLNYQTGYYPAAIEQLDRALKLGLKGGTPSYRNRAEVARAVSLVESGHAPEAREALPKLLALPENAANLDLLLGYAQLLYEEARYTDATKYVDLAVEVNPANGSAHFWRARILQQQDQIPLAIEEAERARELEPDSPAPRSLLVRLYQKSGRTTDASREADWLRERESAAARHLQ